MRTFAATVSLIVVALCALLGANEQAGPVKVRLRLVDAETGKPMGGLIRIRQEGKAIHRMRFEKR